ncbi:MAG TPA: M56 family metallopeptidase [Actinophytocola sp.]|uniref:M56 family metallopeptidase n=1 Tax=Actinophytocola sp. TaxID=1872138 RepID=UPI002DDCB55B|nr:M56 family metallopeptidase [Actinophytocola sp.]HEV2779734.1 M56 family metallopeptidase [Actinophytocola sp.]
MTAALALLSGAAAVGWWLPRRLRRVDLCRRDPLVLIVCWLLAMTGVALAAVAGVILLLLPGHGEIGSLLAVVHHCWDAVQHGSPPRVEEFGGMLGVAILVTAAARSAVVGIRVYRRRTRAGREHLAVLRLAARVDEGRPTTLWMAYDRPLAFCVAGRPGTVVATEGLTRHMAADSVAAVLEHERAHLRGRHHLLIAMVDATSTVLPFVPLFRQAPAAIRELVEVAADVAAVRVCGVAAVRTALRDVSRHGVPGGALAMAPDAIDVRLARLRRPGAVPGRARRAACAGAAGIIAGTVPFLTAAGLMIAIAVLACPLARA